MVPRYSNQNGFRIATKSSFGITNRKQMKHSIIPASRQSPWGTNDSIYSIYSMYVLNYLNYLKYRLQRTLSRVLLISRNHQGKVSSSITTVTTKWKSHAHSQFDHPNPRFSKVTSCRQRETIVPRSMVVEALMSCEAGALVQSPKFPSKARQESCSFAAPGWLS